MSPSLKFLPNLGSEHPPTPGSDWSANAGRGALSDFADSLIVQGANDTPTDQLRSVPSPWARPLLFHHALRSRHHTSHHQIVAEWRGILGCIALSDYLNLDLEVEPITLDTRGETETDTTSIEQTLAQLAPDNDPERKWTKLGLIKIRGTVIGGISPLTIVFTGIRDVASAVPFTKNGRLYDPVEHYSEAGDSISLGLITEWISHVQEELSGGENHPIQEYLKNPNDILQRLEDWSQDTAAGAPGGTTFVESYRPAKLDVHGPQHPSTGLSVIPVAVPSAELTSINDLSLTPELSINPGIDGIILKDGTPYNGQIQLPEGLSQDVVNGRLSRTLPDNALAPSVNPAMHFEERMIEVVGARTDGGALSTGGENDSKSFLYPFGSKLLELLGTNAVRERTSVSGPSAQGYQVTLDLGTQAGFTVRFERTYEQMHVRSDESTPAVAVWPDFDAPEDWEDHFYVIDHLLDNSTGLRLSPWKEADDRDYTSPDGGRYVWGRRTSRVDVWLGTLGNDAGLLIPASPVRYGGAPEQWDVSIDFGSTYTRAFHTGNNNQYIPLNIRERSVVLLGEEGWNCSDIFFPGSNEVHAPEHDELQSILRFPLGLFPTDGTAGPWLPSMGLIHFLRFSAIDTHGLRSHLKWHEPQSEDQKAFRSYLEQLLLLVRAEARGQGATISNVAVAHPSAFNQSLFQRHRQVWESIVPQGASLAPAMTESTALANYIHHKGEAPLQENVSAVDVGGSTSDISVWSNGKKTRVESVRLAGALISKLVATDKDVREALSQALGAAHFAEAQVHGFEEGADRDSHELSYNASLRAIEEHTGKASSIAPGLHNTEQDPGTKLLFHIAYLFSALSYLMGLFRREEDYEASRYYIHFGGHGSDYLNWLDTLEEGTGDSLVKSFFLAGTGKDSTDAEVNVTKSTDEAKHEVGIGLLHNEYRETEGAEGQRKTFLGETGFTSPGSENPVDPFTEVTAEGLKEAVSELATDDLQSRNFLSGFIAAFEATPVSQRVARGLGIDSNILTDELRDRINQRLTEPSSAWANGEDASTFEPVILTEIKVLLEEISGNRNLFSD